VSLSVSVSVKCECECECDAFFLLFGLRSGKSHGIRRDVGLSGAFRRPNVRLSGAARPANVRSVGCDFLRQIP
jgi:hypothetical protein